jgi:hypothetical protein
MPSRIIWNSPGVSCTPASFESLAPQAKSVTAPVQHLQSVSGAIPKDEEMSREGITLKP